MENVDVVNKVFMVNKVVDVVLFIGVIIMVFFVGFF